LKQSFQKATIMNPDAVCLWSNLDVNRNQAYENACTAYDAAEHLATFYNRAGQPVELSAEFVWFNEKALSGVAGNVGVNPAMIAKALELYGACRVATMPDGTTASPTPEAFAEALTYRISSSTAYSMLSSWPETLERIMTTIAKGSTVTAIMFVNSDFFGLTGPWEQNLWDTIPGPLNPSAGVHAFQIGGYNKTSGVMRLKGKNSWSDWGDEQYFGIPFQYVSDPSQNPFLLFIELVPAGVPIINAGWRPDLTPQQLAVQQAYIAYFGRPADLGGLNYWAGVAATVPIGVILDTFATSAESQALYPVQTPAAVITAAYGYLFGRVPEPAGLAWWVNNVTTGACTLGQCIYNIALGALGTDKAAVAAKVEAASVLTYSATSYETATIPAARLWLSTILTEDQVQPAVQSLPC
jgi:hypothetical protein